MTSEQMERRLKVLEARVCGADYVANLDAEQEAEKEADTTPVKEAAKAPVKEADKGGR